MMMNESKCHMFVQMSKEKKNLNKSRKRRDEMEHIT